MVDLRVQKNPRHIFCDLKVVIVNKIAKKLHRGQTFKLVSTFKCYLETPVDYQSDCVDDLS